MCRAVAITQELKKTHGPKLKDFKEGVARTIPREITDLRMEVEDFAKQFPTIGFDKVCPPCYVACLSARTSCSCLAACSERMHAALLRCVYSFSSASAQLRLLSV